MRLLLLGGTGEARALADGCIRGSTLLSACREGFDPALPLGPAGRAGGAAGLRDWLRENDITAVVDATHLFAATITGDAAAAWCEAGVPHLQFSSRPAWQTTGAPDVENDVHAVRRHPWIHIWLLTTGRSGVAAFRMRGAWFSSAGDNYRIWRIRRDGIEVVPPLRPIIQ